MKTRRNFDYMDFGEDYGVLFDAERYSPEESIGIYKMDFNYSDALDIDFEVYEVRVRWFPKMTEEEMWYYDIYDNRDNRGIYKVVEDESIHKDPDCKGFKCWRIKYDRAHEEVRDERSF